MKLSPLLVVFIAVVLAAAAAATRRAPANFDLQEYRRCSGAWLNNECTHITDDSPLMVQLRSAVNCGNKIMARHYASYCTMKENSLTRCGEILSYMKDFRSLVGSCYSAFFMGSCTDECKSALGYLRGKFGCCINEVLNYTGHDNDFIEPMLSNSVWSRACGIEAVPAKCSDEGRLPFTIPTHPRCNDTEEARCRYSALCLDRNVIDRRNRIMQSLPNECQDVLNQVNIDQCSRKRDGTFCYVNYKTDFNKYMVPLVYHCTSRESCSGVCDNALRSFQSDLGCCVNSVFNSSYAVMTGLMNDYSTPILSNQSLFELCDVPAPPLTCRLY